jgi:hypothetical protein
MMRGVVGGGSGAVAVCEVVVAAAGAGAGARRRTQAGCRGWRSDGDDKRGQDRT